MTEFNEPGEWFKISGRGNVFATRLASNFYTDDVLNKEVLISGKLYTVVGIEAFAINRQKTDRGIMYKAGENVGLLVRGEVK